MARERFSWMVQLQGQGQISYAQRIRTAQFGDGYAQVTLDGINTETITLPITWTGNIATGRQIRDFLRNHVAKAFLFTPPFEKEGLYRVVADSINVQPLSRQVCTITATFRSAYAP